MTTGDDYPYDPEPTTQIRPFAERTAKRRADTDIEDRFRRRTLWQIIIGGILLLGLVWVAYQQQTHDSDPDPALVAAVDELRTQVRGLGATPAVPPPEDIVDNPPEVVPVPGPLGPTGARGEQGEPGRPGIDGKDGMSCLPTNPACVGPEGPKGDQGASIQGPAGESIEGPKGDTGEKGDTGSTGASIVAVRIEQQDGRCLMIVTTRDATGTEADLSPVEIPQQFCQGPPPVDPGTLTG